MQNMIEADLHWRETEKSMREKAVSNSDNHKGGADIICCNGRSGSGGEGSLGTGQTNKNKKRGKI